MTRLDTKSDLEARYAEPDPWGYQTSVKDAERKRRVIGACHWGRFQHRKIAGFQRALDIGAGEGWITKDLPARELYAYEISDNAAGRLPDGVGRFDALAFYNADLASFDLVIATGVYYDHYDYVHLHVMTKMMACGIVVTCHLEDSEIPLPCPERQIHEERFVYGDRWQKLRVFDFTER